MKIIFLQNQRLNVRKTVKNEIEMRNQQKEGAHFRSIQKETLQPLARNGINHVIDKNHSMQNKNKKSNTNGRIVDGASLNPHIPPTGVLGNDHKIPGNKIVGVDGKIFPAQPVPVIPSNQQHKPTHLPPNIPQHLMQQNINRNFQPNQVSRDSTVLPADAKGRPSVIQHTTRPGPPTTYGPPGMYGKDTDPRKRPYPFSDPSNSIISERQPFPTPPPAHSNSHRSYLQPELRNFAAAADSIKRLRMEETAPPPLANHCINKYKAGPVKEETKPEVIDLECNETLEPMDFSIKNERVVDDIKTVVPNANSDNGPLCLVTHRRKDIDNSPSTSSHRRPSNSFVPWQGTPKGATLLSPPQHGARPQSGLSHVVPKHDISNHRTSPAKPHRPIPHTSAAMVQNRPPSGAGFLYGPPPQSSISAGLPAHIAGMSPSPNSSRTSSSGSAASSHRHQPSHQHLPARSSSSTPTMADTKVWFFYLFICCGFENKCNYHVCNK